MCPPRLNAPPSPSATQPEQSELFLQTRVLSARWADLSCLPISLSLPLPSCHRSLKQKGKTGWLGKDSGLNRNISEQVWQMQNCTDEAGQGQKSIRRRGAALLYNVTMRAGRNEFTIMGKSNKPHLEINKMRTYGRGFSVSAKSKRKLVYKSSASQPGSCISPFEEL